MINIKIPEESLQLIKEYIQQDYKNVSKNAVANAEFGAKNQFDLQRIKERYSKIKNEFGENWFKNKKILEIGSGSGMMVTYLRKKGLKVFGVEPEINSYKASKILLEENEVPGCIVNGVGEKLPFGNQSFDLLLSFQVLEHTQDPFAVLSESKRVLRSGGLIYFVIPNYQSFWEGHYSLPWLPFLNKKSAKLYVKLLGRNPAFVDSLQLIKIKNLKIWSKKLDLEVLDYGESNFKNNLLNEEIKEHWASNKLLGKGIRFIRRARLDRLLCWFFLKCNFFYPIIFIARKK